MTSLQANHRVRAQLLRKVSASTDLSQTMRRAVRVLAAAGTPSLIVGGYAVQENGYARFTSDVDIVVPDVTYARTLLAAEGFRNATDSRVKHRIFKTVRLLPSGAAIGNSTFRYPDVFRVSKRPTMASLRTVIEIGLARFLSFPLSRTRDLADVVELMKANRPPRDFELHETIQGKYREIWDGLQAETRTQAYDGCTQSCDFYES